LGVIVEGERVEVRADGSWIDIISFQMSKKDEDASVRCVPLNNNGSCGMMATLVRKSRSPIVDISILSITLTSAA
jgi:hypothetical protein